MEDKIFKYGKDITWSLPIMFQYEPIWGTIVKLFKYFQIDVPQVNGFGCPKMAWYGGRLPNITDKIEPRMLRKIFEYCKSTKITPTFTFNRIQITKDDLKDEYSNYILDMAFEYDAHFIVFSDLLKNYIKEKNPNAYMVASVIKTQEKLHKTGLSNWSTEQEANYYNELLKDYDLVVARPEYFSESISEKLSLIDDVSRIEVLINHRCMKDCPKAIEHYLLTEKGQEAQKNFRCIYESFKDMTQIYNSCSALEEETVKQLVKSGIKHLKLEGRGAGYTNVAMSVMLFSYIFQIEGKNIQIQDNLMKNVAKEELDKFANFLNSRD